MNTLSLTLSGLLILTLPVRGQDFAKEVGPTFRARCQGCHGSGVQSNGLRLDDGVAALKGGYSGAVILPGDSKASKLVIRVKSSDKGMMMPPVGPRLKPDEITAIERWIDAGAEWPATVAGPQHRRKSSHWAFQPVVQPEPPSVKDSRWVRNPIDNFVLARLEKEGIAPSPEAAKTTLLRRVKLDLTGLPPTPSEVADFLADTRPDAYERAVDRFLASPHYGERWARPWLDLSRYADSDGFEKDQVRPYAWRYRQWVIDSLNANKPFDRFTIEQIAGDLLPDSTVEQKVATGFHRNALVNREAGVDRKEARFDQLINRTNTVSTTWLGLTTGCAQCHDHKFDPISQKEYYQLIAFFNRADDVNIDAPMPGEMGPYLAALPEYRSSVEALLNEYNVPKLMAHWEDRMRDAIAHPGKDSEFDFSVTSMTAMVDHAQRLLLKPELRTEDDRQRLIRYFVSSPGPEYGRDKDLTAKLKEMRPKLQALDAKFPALTKANTICVNADHPETHIAVRGDFRNPGIAVQPGTPEVLPAMKAGEAPRLEFARWLVSKENPLTPRVTVNRAWQEFFGRGIVRTSEDFGTQGERPTHPLLLDYLASQFLGSGWNLKQLHRTIVTSATYRQSSRYRENLAEKDPENALLARQARIRLPAELIRDSALAASGLLYPEIGGKSIRPPLPKGVAELGYGNSVKWAESEGKDKYRRGLYIHFQRTTPYPQLMNFDEPDSNVACSRRRLSNSPLQALNLLNDPVFHEAAQAMGYAVEQLPAAERIGALYLRALGRNPTAKERETLSKYADLQAGILRAEGKPGELWANVARVVLNLDEFINRE